MIQQNKHSDWVTSSYMGHVENMRKNPDRGFSLLELVIVMALILIVAGMAIPTMNYAIKDYRLRATSSSVKYVYQQARFQSVKDNIMYSVKAETIAGGTRLFVDIDCGRNSSSSNCGTWDAGANPVEPAVDIPGYIVLQSGANSPAYTSMNLTNVSGYVNGVTASSFTISFNSRGLPCTGANPCNTAQGYITYLQDTSRGGIGGFAAISITPAGRMKTWYYSGTSLTSGTWF